MCGIGGYAGDGSAAVLTAMARRLAHRGPDDHGIWVSEGVGLAHTRLSVIDLSPAGRQPMAAPDAGRVIVFNGEIYNHRELRGALEREGVVFRSRSDTEVLLHGFGRWGKSVLERLRGMFAFAVWDARRRALFIARDRLGIKPLFYAQLSSGLVFASEIKALLAHPGVRREMNPAAADAYFELGYVPGPATIFEGIRSLAPGSFLEYADGRTAVRKYWAPDFCQKAPAGSEDELLDQLDQCLNDAVKSHLVSDVPVGAFLSGGIDSSLVCAVAQKHLAEPLRTFTIGFEGGGDERRYARAVAAHIGSDHREELAAPDLVADLPLLVDHLEQPLFDNSILPTYLVSRLARRHVKVALSGDGGDEPFAGYEWMRRALTIPRLPGGWKPTGWAWAYRCGAGGLAARLAYDATHSVGERYRRRVAVCADLRSWLYHPRFQDRLGGSIGDSTPGFLKRAPVADERDRLVHADLCRYLPDDVLFKVDRMSMSQSLEVRVPLLDFPLLTWVLSLPFALRFRRGRGKHLLRRLAARYLPAEALKPRKQGFTVPVGRWLRRELGGWAEKLFRSEAFAERQVVRPEAALELLERHRSRRYDLGHRIWQIAVFEVWARRWLDRVERRDLPGCNVWPSSARSGAASQRPHLCRT